MTFDDENDAYDPLIAERFKLLDRATPTALSRSGRDDAGTRAGAEAGADVSTMAEAPLLGHGEVAGVERQFRPLQLLAAAAAAVVTVGGVVLAIGALSDDPSLEAGDQQTALERPDQSPTGDAGVEADDGDRSLTVELPSTTTELAGDDQADDQADDNASDPGAEASGSAIDGSAGSTPGTTTTSPDGEDRAGLGQGGTVADEGETDDPNSTDPPITTTEPPPTTVPTTEQRPIETTETTDLTPDSSWLNPPTAEKMISIRGTITEVFTDCQSRLILNEQGEVEDAGPVTCDGGSYIIVDGRRIQTASGYLLNEADRFAKHVVSLRPGQRVTVTAVPTASAGGMLTLNCVLCAINVGG